MKCWVGFEFQWGPGGQFFYFVRCLDSFPIIFSWVKINPCWIKQMAFHVPLPMIWLLNYHDRCQMAFKVPINDRYWAFVLCSTKLFFLCLFLLNCHYMLIIWLLVYCFFKSIPLKLPCIVISLLIYLFHILSLIPKFRDPVMSPLPMFHLKYLFCSDKLLLKYPFL